MHEFQFDAVGIGKEHCVVARYIIILAWRIENAAPVGFNTLGQLVDLGAIFCVKSDFTQSDSIFVERVSGELGAGFLYPETPAVTGPASHLAVVMHVGIAKLGHKPGIKSTG